MMSKHEHVVVTDDVESDVDENAPVDVDDSGSDVSIPSPREERLMTRPGSPGVQHEDLRDTPTPDGSLSPSQISESEMRGKSTEQFLTNSKDSILVSHVCYPC